MDSDRLLNNRLESLLPALPRLAEQIRKYGMPALDSMSAIVIACGINERWGLEELQRWAKALMVVRGGADEDTKRLARNALLLRGLPEANAILAVDEVARGVVPSEAPSNQWRGPRDDSPKTMPVGDLQAPPPALALGRIIPDRYSLCMGTLNAGQPGQARLVVHGGPGKVRVKSDRIVVTPMEFGQGSTELEVLLRPGNANQLFCGSLALTNGQEEVEVDIIAQWRGPKPVEIIPDSGPEPPSEPPPEPPKGSKGVWRTGNAPGDYHGRDRSRD